MKTIKTKGIILLENNMGDYDKMLTMLTPGLGKIGCAAKGARRPKSLLLAGSQFLCFGEYILYKGSNNYTINSCDTIEVFYNLRTDWDKLKYAVCMTKIVSDVTYENENSYKILQLFLNSLYMVSETDKNLDLVLAIFKLKLLSIIGFKPQIEKCVCCKEESDIESFSIKDNGVKCKACSKQDASSIKISEGTYNALKYINMAPSKKLFSFNLNEDCMKEINLISKIYLNEKLEREYKL